MANQVIIKSTQTDKERVVTAEQARKFEAMRHLDKKGKPVPSWKVVGPVDDGDDDGGATVDVAPDGGDA